MKKCSLVSFFFLYTVVFLCSAAIAASGSPLAGGRYMVKMSGCNDCHTAGWMITAGKVPEAEWLAGDTTGWSGPWGTTYAINLRLFVKDLSEDAWITTARGLKARPPMPWYAVREMKEKDLRAIYRLLKKLGPDGAAAPAYLPPGQKPEPPYFMFVPPVVMPTK